jgi:hypothetical protein
VPLTAGVGFYYAALVMKVATLAAILTWATLASAGQLGVASRNPPQQEQLSEAPPYHFSEAERTWFLERHENWPEVDTYLRNPAATPWGIVVSDFGREFLVFSDARSAVHVIEVTGQPMADAVVKRPFESPRFEVVGL